MKTIAFIGLGAMGSRMAKNLLRAGYVLQVWNRNPQQCQELVSMGAKLRDTPAEVAQGADVVVSMVRDDAASQQIWLNETNGAVNGLAAGSVVIECSTLSPQWCQDLAQRIEQAGGKFLEAPVIGSRPQAENGQLIHLIGGNQENLAQVDAVLEVNAAAIHYIGEAGTAMTMKLVVNALFATQVAALGEALGVLHKSGTPLAQSVSILNQLPTTSPALKGIANLISTENYAPLFPITLVDKDLAYMAQLSELLEQEIPVVNAVKAKYRKAIETGFGNDNIAGVAQLNL